MNNIHSTHSIIINQGIKQGDTLSAKLFTLTLEGIFKQLNWKNKGILINSWIGSITKVKDVTVTITELKSAFVGHVRDDPILS